MLKMNEQTFLFYDLETTGLNPRKDRVMQFAGQRTDMDLRPVGQPFNLIVRLTDEVLPDPFAILTTGITPQFTVREGMREADFVKRVQDEVFTPGTIVVGFNTVRFDDDFMRHTFYRNFYDPYEWSWQDGRSRWDLLDVVRMTRALRPEGIKWPVTDEGKSVNRLELITKLNGIEHEQAHDALSDVTASIDVARLLREKQPELFNYLLKMRDKKEVAGVVDVNDPKPFVYSSGRLGSANEFTSVCVPISIPDSEGRIYVYDLRYDPADYDGLSASDLRGIRFAKREQRQKADYKPFPGKDFAFNKCPAVAPLGVLRHDDQERIQLDIETIQRHWTALKASDLRERMCEALKRDTAFPPSTDVDGALYDGFFGAGDKNAMAAIRSASESQIKSLKPHFSDARLPELFLRYKARNYPDALTDTEATEWEAYRAERIATDLPTFAKHLEMAAQKADEQGQSLLQDLQMWAQSIIPEAD